MMRKHIILILTLVMAFVSLSALAQVRDTDIVLTISPQYPNPDQSVNATLNSHTTNLDKANISWSVNGQELSTGIGKKSFSFRMGITGDTTTLFATIDTLDGQNILKTMTISPADIDMLYEAYDAYTPPFYKGRTLVPSQGTFKVVAMPSVTNQGGKINVNNLSYIWSKDDKIQNDSSGWGKNYFIFQNSYLDKETVIGVKVSDISGSVNASQKITLRPVDPKIVFYKNDPLLGIKWERALSNGFTISSKGETITAEPYFFSPKDTNSGELTFDWFLSGQKIQTPTPKNILSIKPEAGQSGEASIRLDINNINTLFQSMTKQINVEF